MTKTPHDIPMNMNRWNFVTGALASLILMSAPSLGAETLKWPDEWVVFAPLDQHDEVIDAEFLREIPDQIEIPESHELPARTLEPQIIEVQPGRSRNLIDFFDEQTIGNAAYVFLELESPEDQEVKLGFGADWWLEVWLNGEPIFDTLEAGNETAEINMTNHTVTVPVREGRNILAVRFISGRGSSYLALGGPDQFEEAEERIAARLRARRLNILPENFEDRLLFPVDRQALIMAERDLDFPDPGVDLAEGALAGLQPMPERQIYFRPIRANVGEILDTVEPRFDEPVRVQLSKYRYPWEDLHLDAMVWTTTEDEETLPTGELEIVLKTGEGEVLARHEIDELSPSGLFFSVGFPEALKGEDGVLEVIWREDGEVVGSGEAAFKVTEPSGVAESGRVPLRILNAPGAVISNAPMTLGVPFPRGALLNPDRVRLVDEEGLEFPLQTRVTGKWSRFGSVKWLLCDFTVDLDGEPREVYLEFGPEVTREAAPVLAVETDGPVLLETGRLQVTRDSVGFDPDGEGNYQPVLAAQAMHGAFVKHENGRTYVVPTGIDHAVEELGSEKVVIRRSGWYEEPESGETFCQFVTRLVFHRNSPVVRIFHTWIFTGDGNADRIADMGWRFETAGEFEEAGISLSFDDDEWTGAPGLVQFDYQDYLLLDADGEHEGRTPGVLTGEVDGNRVTFGVKDFWQNFPSELETADQAFTFYNWPRHNPPERLERPVAREDAFRSRFVHEGEVLDFRIPDEYATGPIWRESSSREGHIAQERPESVNAQGIARTEEMFLYFTDASKDRGEVLKVMRGLNDETLRAVADPQWVVGTGVFGNIRHRDAEKYPEEEHLSDLALLAPSEWVERLGFYGMWVHGDYPTWNMNLRDRTVSTYRTLRKNHHAYPYRWSGFARSGDPRFLKLADAAVRQMTDANFCHFATEDVDAAVGPDHYRRQGWWDRSLLPWAGRQGPHRRSYTVDSDYLWDAYYLTGYGRAKDVALLFGELTKEDHVSQSPHRMRTRTTQSMMSSYLDMYQATFDPWFLNSALAIGDLHDQLYGDEPEVDQLTLQPDLTGHTWRSADQKLYRFTGSDAHRHLALNNARGWSSPRAASSRVGGHAGGWGGGRGGLAAFAWQLTDDDFYLGRVAASLDRARIGLYDGDVEHYRGTYMNLGHGGVALGWGGMGGLLWMLEEVGELPEPIHNPFIVGTPRSSSKEDIHEFRLSKVSLLKEGSDAVPVFLDASGRGRDGSWPESDLPPYEYTLHGPNDTRFSGEWRAPEAIEIPADAPEGVYRLEITGALPYPDGVDQAWFRRRHASVFHPVSSPETPEIMVYEHGESGTRTQAPGQGYWFYVPEGTETFWIEFNSGGQGPDRLNRASVWRPDGERIWDLSYTASEKDPRVEVEVPPGQDGKLWRATGGGFTIDPQVPPYFSISRSKWFDPED